MASTAKISMKFGFADETERAFELGGFSTEAAVVNADTLRSKIKALDLDTLKDIYISESGATCTGVTAATISKVSETDINLKVTE